MTNLEKGSERLPNWIKNPYLLVATVFYVLMFVLGSIRVLEHYFIWTFNDKLLHFVAYLVLTTLVYQGLKSRPIGEFFMPRILWCWAIISGAAAVDEIAQYFVGRDPSFDDWLADIAATIFMILLLTLGHGVLWVWHWYRQNQNQNQSQDQNQSKNQGADQV